MLEKQKTQPNFGNAGAINNLIRAAIAKAATRPSRPDGKIQLEVSSTIQQCLIIQCHFFKGICQKRVSSYTDIYTIKTPRTFCTIYQRKTQFTIHLSERPIL